MDFPLRFINILLQENAVANYKADKKYASDIYYRNRPSTHTLNFRDQLQMLLRNSYIIKYTSQIIFFNKNCIDYLIHQAQLQQLAMDPSKYVNEKQCNLCAKKFTNDASYQSHIKECDHIIRLNYIVDRQYFTNYLKMEIKSAHKSLVWSVQKQISLYLKLTNNQRKTCTILRLTQINSQIPEIQIMGLSELPIVVPPNAEILIELQGVFQNSCKFNYPIVVAVLTPSQIIHHCLIEIPIEIRSQYSNLILPQNEKVQDTNSTKNEIEKATPQIEDHTEEYDIVPGYPLQTPPSQYQTSFPLPYFNVPQELSNQMLRLNSDFANTNNIFDHAKYKIYAKALNIPGPLDPKNYIPKLHQLLYIEEVQMQIDIKNFNTISVLTAIPDDQHLFELKVPGLAESRPSLLVGDRVYIYNKKHSTRVKFEGIVHKVLIDKVHLGFDIMFQQGVHLPNIQFNIEFGFNRRTLRVEHQSLELAQTCNIVEYFFPSTALFYKTPNMPELHLYNTNLNDHQKIAVRNILQLKSAPYLIFGPPGTGKTATIVESVLQVWNTMERSKILICAPSNAAANEIAIRLVKIVPKSQIMRLLGSIHGLLDYHNKALSGIINVNASKEYYMPSMLQLIKYRIVITTLVTSARLINGGIPRYHFTYVFIDESGYATETETLIPIAGNLTLNESFEPNRPIWNQIVLAGDPQQLGPRIHSNLAKYCGLGTSMLARLMETLELYQRNEAGSQFPYDPEFITKLVINYRSHEAILKTSNELFYNNELICAGNEFTDLFCNSMELLLTANFPIIFHNVVGDDKQDKDSPSYFNVQEIEVVMEYLKKLVGTRVKGMQIQARDIGIITPYRKQVEKLNVACSGVRNHSGLLIGSVEQFQGKEKLIIIISTVRSKSDKFVEQFDDRFHLGFLRNPKRFNVAITRPKSLLIVVGNLNLLKKDKYWSRFIEYGLANKSVTGKKMQTYTETVDSTENPHDLTDGVEGVDFSRGIV